MPSDDTVWLDLFYGELGSAEIDMGDGSDTTKIWSTPSNMIDGLTLDGDGGNDSFNVEQSDAAGNPTIGGAVTINGGSGSDNVAIDNAAATIGQHYTIFSVLGSTWIRTPTLANVATGSDVELLDLRAGSGDDEFDVDDFKAATTRFDIEGNSGNDTLTLSRRSMATWSPRSSPPRPYSSMVATASIRTSWTMTKPSATGPTRGSAAS